MCKMPRLVLGRKHATTQQIRKPRREPLGNLPNLLRSEALVPTQAVRQQSPGVDGGSASPHWGSKCACVPACAHCAEIPLFPHPAVLCAITQTPSHPQQVIQPRPTTRSLPVTPTGLPPVCQGASLTLPTLSFLHLEGPAAGWSQR